MTRKDLAEYRTKLSKILGIPETQIWRKDNSITREDLAIYRTKLSKILGIPESKIWKKDDANKTLTPAEIIEYSRKEHLYSITDFCKMAHISSSHYYNIINRGSGVNEEVLCKIESVLGISFDREKLKTSKINGYILK